MLRKIYSSLSAWDTVGSASPFASANSGLHQDDLPRDFASCTAIASLVTTQPLCAGLAGSANGRS